MKRVFYYSLREKFTNNFDDVTRIIMNRRRGTDRKESETCERERGPF